MSTVFYNPAGLPALWKNDAHRTATPIAAPATDDLGFRFGLGASVIDYSAEIRNGGTTSKGPGGLENVSGRDGDDPIEQAVIPNVFVAKEVLNGELYLGMGVTAPFGLAAEYDGEWFGRYDTLEAALRTINVSFVAARKFAHGISLGGGLDVQRAKAVLASVVRTGDDGIYGFRGNDLSFGYNMGVVYEASTALQIGIHYRSEVRHTFDGTATLRPLKRARASADFNLPSILSVGAVYKIDPVRLYVNAGWYDWSTLQNVEINASDLRLSAKREVGLRDGYDIAVGIEHDVTIPGVNIGGTTVRMGVKYDSTPTRDSTRSATFPDASRVWLGVGLTQHIGKRWTLDLAYNHVFFEDATIAFTPKDNPPVPLVTTRATVASRVNTVAVGIGGRF